MCRSPTHNLARWLTKLLNPIRWSICKYSLKDSFELVDYLCDIDIKEKTMCSFDVNSLFTNVPLKKTIDILCDYILTSHFSLPIPVATLKDLLLLCTDKVQFTFEGEYFRQIDGVAMGSPLGPLLADVYMAHVENLVSDSIGEMYLYKRYVDDILIICTKIDDANRLLRQLNTIQNHISLSCEEENNNQLPFLDILINRRDDGSIKRSVYRKSTWTGQYMNFHSYCPVQYKKNLVKALFNRTNRICTSDTIEENDKLLTETLMLNGYPKKFINRWKRCSMVKPTVLLAPKKSVYITLPFRGDSNSLVLKQRLKSVVNRTFYAAEVVVIEKYRSLIHNKPKPHVNECITSHCIYQFTCMCGHTYIGRSNRELQVRVAEHIPKWLRKQMDSKGEIKVQDKQPSSSIAKHLVETGHIVDIKSAFVVLYKSALGRILKFVEALAIRKFKPPLCVQKQFVLSLNLPW
ncbi:hypothetical protein MN116_000516 [Schistosoma mekongi]|uniref:Reverse transcriptase domain-containing protein n=1 Tax=Schistosoma mekongi TaxID=38744 RepID=A0AAE2D5S0_SCHME|nr:hypothetical protein MN116_000516 [Schistosoma mekongi]